MPQPEFVCRVSLGGLYRLWVERPDMATWTIDDMKSLARDDARTDAHVRLVNARWLRQRVQSKIERIR